MQVKKNSRFHSEKKIYRLKKPTNSFEMKTISFLNIYCFFIELFTKFLAILLRKIKILDIFNMYDFF